MEGSCNCKKVTFTASDEVKAIVNCHCNLCRKMNGGAYSTYVVVKEDGFQLDTGTVKSVQASENASKSFCEDCGSPIYNENPKLAGLKILYLGAIDSEVEYKPALNIYCESQLSWVNDIETLPSMPQGVR